MPIVYTTYVAESLFEEKGGSGEVIVLRQKSSLKVEAGVFLVDAMCLGIRDAFFYTGTESEVMDNLLNELSAHRVLSGGYGRQFVEEAVAYAKQFGFAPHKGYKKASRVFGGLKAADDLEGFTFGKNGKPFYIQTPEHDANDAHRILATLRKACGDGGFDFLLEDSYSDDTEERLILSEAWLSLDSDQKPTDAPSEAAKRKFLEFSNNTDLFEEELLNKHVWENHDGSTIMDQLLEITQLHKSTLLENIEGGETVPTFLTILMFLMNLLDKDEAVVEAELRSLKEDTRLPPGFYDLTEGLIHDATMRVLLETVVHPKPSITICPLSLEVVDEQTGHYLLICVEEYDPETAD